MVSSVLGSRDRLVYDEAEDDEWQECLSRDDDADADAEDNDDEEDLLLFAALFVGSRPPLLLLLLLRVSEKLRFRTRADLAGPLLPSSPTVL